MGATAALHASRLGGLPNFGQLGGVGGEIGACGKSKIIMGEFPASNQFTANCLQTTAHGTERIAGSAATRGGVLSLKGINTTKTLGKGLIQADGATVYLHEIRPGRFNVVVQGQKGIITTMEDWPQKSINRIAKNYGWKIE
jgi:hypothetical protein